MLGYLPYILFICFSILFSLLETLIKKEKFSMLMFSFLLLLFVAVAVLRSNTVGIDTNDYTLIYESAKTKTFVDFVGPKVPEVFYYGLVFFFSSVLKINERVFWLFLYLIICLFLFLSFRDKEKRCFMLSIFFFFGFFRLSLSGIRQTFSWSISTFLVCYLMKIEKMKLKNILFYLALMLIAIGFHTSSIITVIFPLAKFIKLSKKDLVILFLTSLITGPIFIGASIFGMNFVRDGYYFPFTNRMSLIHIGMIIFAIVFLFFTEEKNMSKLKNKISFEYEPLKNNDNFLLILFVIYCFILSANIGTTVITRFAFFFYIAPLSILYNLICAVKNTKINAILTCAFIIAFGLFFLKDLPSLGEVPYAFFF